MLLRDVSLAAVVLLLCVQRLHGSALPAVSSYELTAYRMQQYNLVQQKHGKFRCLSPSTVDEFTQAPSLTLHLLCFSRIVLC